MSKHSQPDHIYHVTSNIYSIRVNEKQHSHHANSRLTNQEGKYTTWVNIVVHRALFCKAMCCIARNMSEIKLFSNSTLRDEGKAHANQCRKKP